MPFDINAARQANKSDTEIADYLGSTLGFDVEAARKAGKTDTQIAEYLATNERPADKSRKQSVSDIIKSTGVSKMFDNGGGTSFGAKDIAPMMLGTAGGIIGAGSTLGVGAPIGGVLGYAAGKNLNRAIGLDEQVSLPETAKRTVTQDLPEGMLAEITGNLFNRGVVKASNAITSRTVTPEMAARQAMYEKANVPYTAADVTQKKGLGLIEGALRRNVASASKAQDFDLSKLRAIQAEASRVENQFGGKVGKLEAGQEAQKQVQSRYGKFMDIADELYNSVPIDPTTPIETPGLRDVAIGHLDELGKMGKGVSGVLKIAEESMTPSSILSPAGSPYSGGSGFPTYTWQQLKDDRSTLIKMAKSTSDYRKKAILNDLVTAMNDDISKFSDTFGVPEVKSAFDKANKFYRMGNGDLPGVGTFRDAPIQNVRVGDGPEKIVDNFIKPNNPSAIVKLSKATGPEGMKAVKSAWVSRMFETGEGRSFSPARFATEINKYDDATLNAFLTKNEISGLKSLAELSKSASAVERMAGNPSGTAQQTELGSTVRSAITHPILTTLQLIGTSKFADKYFSDPVFRNYLIAGSKVKPDSKAASAIAAKLATMAGISEINGSQNE